MSRIIASIIALSTLGPAIAAPREKPPSPEALAAGEQFARQLGVIAQSISREYVRPIPTSELYEPAIKSIFDAARRPHPKTILSAIRGSKSETELIDLVKKARAELHGAKALDDGRDLFIAVSAFTSVLDPHSLLISSSSMNGTTTLNTYGFEFEGEAQPKIGPRKAEIFAPPPDDDDFPPGMPTIPFRVFLVKPGSPAQKAGLLPGDIVREINGVVADTAGASKAFTALRGEGTKGDTGVHQLLVDRAGRQDLLKLRLERAAFVAESLFGVTRKWDNSWDYWLDRGKRIAYVRLTGIEVDSGDRLQEILHDLRDIRGLVFDLRWCPGGYIDAATQIASTFLESGLIAKMKYRNPDRGENTTIHADGGLVRYKAGDYPVLLLVNGETTGGGELIAAAIRDNNRAVLAGSRTYGKASIQWPISMPGLPGYSFKLSGGTYTRPNGKNMQRFTDSKPSDDWGLRPDPGYEIPMSAGLSRKLKEMHHLYTLRPGGNREAHELDDPAADPQRARALKQMLKLVDERAKRK